MIKKLKLFALMLLAFAGTALAQKKATTPEWPEMKKFHSFMSTTFHPAEEGNLAPLRAKADSLVSSSKAWQASPIAANYKPLETKAALTKLVAQCEKIKKAVNDKATDDQLKVLITDAHDIFHTIVGECRNVE